MTELQPTRGMQLMEQACAESRIVGRIEICLKLAKWLEAHHDELPLSAARSLREIVEER